MEKNKGGRPTARIDYETLAKLCQIHCTGEECASILEMDYDTLNNNLERDGHIGFTDYFKRKSASGKASLRRKQIAVALDGNPTMLIWMGKQQLDQRDNRDQVIDHKGTIPVHIAADEADL